jgi:hypothetical protein
LRHRLSAALPLSFFIGMGTQKNPHASAGNIQKYTLRQLAGIAQIKRCSPFSFASPPFGGFAFIGTLYILVSILYTQLENIARKCRKFFKLFFQPSVDIVNATITLL